MSAPFEYVGDELHCERVPLAQIAAEVGTPVYVYSRTELERAYRAFDAALDGIPHRTHYAVKANASLGILAVLVELGAGADIVSAGELFRWQKAGGELERLCARDHQALGAQADAQGFLLKPRK